MGRPTTYRGMTTLWNSDGTLANMGGKYSYIRRNFDGMIYERREGTHPYLVSNTITDGNKILVDNRLTFIYILDKLVGFMYNENRYYYQRNILGDITHIYSEDGVLVAKYVYDGYGRHKVLNSLNEEDTNLYSIGNLNPFRYRGYYYDRVLGLYNLISRYYDPEVCRFISPDTISILDKTKLDINGLNLYMYCNDNPIMFVDPSGHIAISTFLLILGGITAGLTLTGATMGGISAGVSGGDVGDVFAGIGKGALNGFLLGGSISLIAGGFAIGGTTVLGSMMASYGISTLSNFIEVGVTQGMKSAGEGLGFWNITNNINKSMFANSGAILTGQVPLIPIDIYGSRLATKGMFLFNAFVNYDIDKFFGAKGIPYSLYAISELFSTASKFSLGLSYGLAGATVLFSVLRLCMKDYENSPWKLY